MRRRSPTAGFDGRTQQAGTAVAATMMPLTFQRTLMPKSGIDQAVITGISGALNYGFAALIQDTIEAVALRLSGGTSPDEVSLKTWRRASVAVDIAAMGLGMRHPDLLPGATRRAASARGGTHRGLVDQRHRPGGWDRRAHPGGRRPRQGPRGPVAPGRPSNRHRARRRERVPASALGGGRPRGRSRTRTRPPRPPSPSRMGLGVTVALNAAAASGERVFAAGVEPRPREDRRAAPSGCSGPSGTSRRCR